MRHWYFCLAVVLIVVTLLPYWYGFEKQTDTMQFSGSFLGVEDHNSYLAKMRNGYEGEWLFRTPYTSEPQRGILAFLPFILIGKLAGGSDLHAQFLFYFQILRIGSVFLYLYGLGKFYSHYIQNKYWLKVALILCLFGGGLGWLYFLGLRGLWQNRIPLEFYSPEAFSFLAIFTLPHIIFARAFFFLSLVAWLQQKAYKIGKININYISISTIYAYLVYLFQPITFSILLLLIYLLTMGTIILDFYTEKNQKFFDLWIRRKQGFMDLAKFTLLIMPLILYNLYLLLFDPFVKAWTQQNILTSPPFFDYVLAYLPWILFSLLALPKRAHWCEHRYLYWGVWILGGIASVYLPLTIQRRFIEGIWVVMVLLAVKGIQRLPIKATQHWLFRAGIGLSCLSTLFLWIGSFFQLGTLKAPVYVEKEHIALFEFLDTRFGTDDWVFANHAISNQIPAWTKVNTVVGLGPESIGEPEILQRYQAVLDNSLSSVDFGNFLMEKRVTAYVIELSFAANFPFCNEIYQNEDFIVCLIGYDE